VPLHGTASGATNGKLGPRGPGKNRPRWDLPTD